MERKIYAQLTWVEKFGIPPKGYTALQRAKLHMKWADLGALAEMQSTDMLFAELVLMVCKNF